MAKVRLFTFAGLQTADVVAGNNHREDSVQLLKFPYIGKLLLNPGTVTALNSAASSPTNRAVNLAFVQVEAGKSVYYELTPEGHDLRVADANSPILRGDTTMVFGANWQISVLEAT